MVTITSLAKDERTARIALAVTLEPDDAVTGRLLAAVGAVETVRLAAATGALPKRIDLAEGTLWRRKVAPRMDVGSVERALAASDRLRLGILVPGDRDWPAALDDLGERAPVALWVRGASSFLAAARADRVTITGARAATGYGEHVAGELSAELTNQDRIVVAGGAYGIDHAAHRSALTAGGQTIAVLPSGLDRLYPSGNRELLEHIGDTGALVSEIAPGAAPTRWRLLARNRVLGALSGATVIVEAGHRSGSLHVAARAAELDRPVGAVPGPVTSAASAGTHRLLREGVATIVTDAQDIASLLSPPTARDARSFQREAAISRPGTRQGASRSL